MSKDEFDFTGKNLAKLLPVDKKAVPFDYEAQLKQKGYAKESPPDMGGLFQALATEYVPTRVVSLPPKIVTRVRMSDFLWPLFASLFLVLFLLFLYVCIVVLLGFVIPLLKL